MITRFNLFFILFGIVSGQYNYEGYSNNQNVNQNQYQQNGYGSWGSNNYGNNNMMNLTTTERSNQGVSLQIQLKGYSNMNSLLPNNNTCICPTGTCNIRKRNPECYFAFNVIASSKDGSARHMTDFVYLENGQLPQSSQNSWGSTYVMQLPSKPAAIIVLVYHLGAVITQSGQLVSVDTLTLVDTFVISLLDTLPTVDGVMNDQRTYQGRTLGTSLSLRTSVSCAGSLIGSNCDLHCTKSHITTNIAQCISNSTGYYSICEYVSNGQVDRCKKCPWGVREGTYCQDANGGVLDPREAGFVGSGWQTAVIILIIALFIVTLLFCASILFTCQIRAIHDFSLCPKIVEYQK